jgi:hypothetical protein
MSGQLADDRSELLRAQARARAEEHRRRQQAKAAAREAQALAPVVPDDEEKVAHVWSTSTPAPDRRLTAQERAEAAEMAQNRRTVWLPAPIVDPVTGRRVLAYDPQECPAWLAAELATVTP